MSRRKLSRSLEDFSGYNSTNSTNSTYSTNSTDADIMMTVMDYDKFIGFSQDWKYCWSEHWGDKLNNEVPADKIESQFEEFKDNTLMNYCTAVLESEFDISTWEVYKPGSAWNESYECVFEEAVQELETELEIAHTEYIFWVNFCDLIEDRYEEYLNKYDQNPQDAPNFYDDGYISDYDYSYGGDKEESTYYSGEDYGDSDYLLMDEDADKAIEEMMAAFESLDFDSMDFNMDP